MTYKKYFLIDHRILFLFGYLFYFFTPYIVGINDSFHGFPGMELYQGFFKLVPQQKLTAYLIITFSWLPAFYLGHFGFKLIRPYKRSLQLFPGTTTTHSISYIGFFLVCVLVVFAYLGRNSLFAGYGSYDVGARGKISTLLVIFNFFLLFQLVSKQTVSIFLIGGTIITSLLLLSMGGRLYVMQTLIIYLIYKTSFATKRWNFFMIAGFAFAGFLIASVFGLWRVGSSFGLEKAAYSFFAEPVFTWISTGTFLAANDIPLVNVPGNFITSFLNLVPNTIITLKPYIISTQAMVKNYQNPLGAESVWSTFVINFGSVGSCCFIFLTGFMLNFLRHLAENKRFWAVYYMLVCGMLPFQFFRDGFYIINKQLFFNFLLFPALMLIILKTAIYISGLKDEGRRGLNEMVKGNIQ